MTLPKRLRWLCLTIGILGCLIVTAPLFVFGYAAISERFQRTDFESLGWKHGGTPYGMNDARLRMVDSLFNSKILSALDRKAVEELLGKSDGDPVVKTRFPVWEMYFYLGPSRSTVLFKGFNYDYLVIRFGPNGKVSDATIVLLKT